ncbi:hypothetical protein ACWD5Q_10675 [Streptomyces sp. NPDC002513]
MIIGRSPGLCRGGRGRRRRCCGPAGLARGGFFRDGGDFAGAGVAPVAVAQVDGDALEEFFVQAFPAGVDGLAATVFDQPFQEADDAVGAVVEVLGHRALGEHAGDRVQEPKAALDAMQVLDPGGDLRCGAVVEAIQLDQVETPFGLSGLQSVGLGMPGGREPPLSGGRVVAPLAQQTGARDVDADQDQGDVHAHERADQVEGVLVVGPVHAKPRDVVQDQDLGAVVP